MFIFCVIRFYLSILSILIIFWTSAHFLVCQYFLKYSKFLYNSSHFVLRFNCCGIFLVFWIRLIYFSFFYLCYSCYLIFSNFLCFLLNFILIRSSLFLHLFSLEFMSIILQSSLFPFHSTLSNFSFKLRVPSCNFIQHLLSSTFHLLCLPCLLLFGSFTDLKMHFYLSTECCTWTLLSTFENSI